MKNNIAQLGLQGKDLIVRIKPLIGGDEIEYKISMENENEWPVTFNTNSAPEFKDFIGDVVAIDGNKCTVRGAYKGRVQDVRNIRICSKEIKKTKDRVMVTEHMDVSGRFDFIATKQRVLFEVCHWVNVGWSNEKRCRHLRVDLYTGDCKEITTGPNVSIFVGGKS